MTHRNRLLHRIDLKDWYVTPPNHLFQNKKISDAHFFIPKIHEYMILCEYNFRATQLKQICKAYKIKATGVKGDMTYNIYNTLRLSHYANKIQTHIRGKLQRRCISYQGPACIQREKCVNETDFYTLENIKDIPMHQFFSYIDDDNFIYGFNVMSIYTLLHHRTQIQKKRENPYNRKIIPVFVKTQLMDYISLSKILKIDVHVRDEEEEKTITDPYKSVENKAIELFHYIDNLGNYTNCMWFLSLTKPELIMYIRELYDIWNYRASLTIDTKLNICPPSGDPFRGNNLLEIHAMSLIELQQMTLHIISRFVKSGISQDNQSLGAFYVLSALTLVNSDAADALPWLFQSVNHNN